MFGSVPDSESVPTEIREPGLGETRTTDEPESAVRATGSQNLPLAVHERSSSQACEGWAPPPVTTAWSQISPVAASRETRFSEAS